jgi:hypothetical protein
MNRLGYVDNSEEVISIRQEQQAAAYDPAKSDPVAIAMRPVAEWLAKEKRPVASTSFLQESKQIANPLQDTVVKQQLLEHCEQRRKCLTCGSCGD